ncbi:hypothetical protein Celaphus_00002890 [Cervus elaphus hippelaphus]|uniref:Uncharacterized protein n=1 Tax=Cervus elaphus hippelaphus TaxID=46360 RepID=A0A212D147_CEREH|nr:hypothetical protein Celaphus_00002890 [Cervus elaphus hippelaphus]
MGSHELSVAPPANRELAVGPRPARSPLCQRVTMPSPTNLATGIPSSKHWEPRGYHFSGLHTSPLSLEAVNFEENGEASQQIPAEEKNRQLDLQSWETGAAPQFHAAEAGGLGAHLEQHTETQVAVPPLQLRHSLQQRPEPLRWVLILILQGPFFFLCFL